MKQVNRKYKDSLFRDIFNNPERLAEIYEALLGNRVFPEDIALATIDETLFTGKRSTSTNRARRRLAFLGRFRIRAVIQSPASFGLVSWTAQ